MTTILYNLALAALITYAAIMAWVFLAYGVQCATQGAKAVWHWLKL